MIMRQRRLKIAQAAGAAVKREEFRAGRLHGSYASNGRDAGRLPEEYRDVFASVCQDPFTYVLRSNGTPIAWRTFAQGWTVPDVDRVIKGHRQVVELIVQWEAEHAVDLDALVG